MGLRVTSDGHPVPGTCRCGGTWQGLRVSGSHGCRGGSERNIGAQADSPESGDGVSKSGEMQRLIDPTAMLANLRLPDLWKMKTLDVRRLEELLKAFLQNRGSCGLCWPPWPPCATDRSPTLRRCRLQSRSTTASQTSVAYAEARASAHRYLPEAQRPLRARCRLCSRGRRRDPCGTCSGTCGARSESWPARRIGSTRTHRGRRLMRRPGTLSGRGGGGNRRSERSGPRIRRPGHSLGDERGRAGARWHAGQWSGSRSSRRRRRTARDRSPNRPSRCALRASQAHGWNGQPQSMRRVWALLASTNERWHLLGSGSNRHSREPARTEIATGLADA